MVSKEGKEIAPYNDRKKIAGPNLFEAYEQMKADKVIQQILPLPEIVQDMQEDVKYKYDLDDKETQYVIRVYLNKEKAHDVIDDLYELSTDNSIRAKKSKVEKRLQYKLNKTAVPEQVEKLIQQKFGDETMTNEQLVAIMVVDLLSEARGQFGKNQIYPTVWNMLGLGAKQIIELLAKVNGNVKHTFDGMTDKEIESLPADKILQLMTDKVDYSGNSRLKAGRN